MAKKILILGANGMLGTDLMKVFKSFKPVGWTKEDLDITDSRAVLEKIVSLAPNVVINAAAYTAVDEAEKNQDLANAINGYAVGNIANACYMVGAVLVHYSTDYVFDGENKKGYKEDDDGSPVNAYGVSKYLGEQMIFLRESQSFIKCPSSASCPKVWAGGRGCDDIGDAPKFNYYLIRTSWLYGAAGNNFVDTMLGLAQNNDKLKVVNDQRGKPTYTLDLAKRTLELVKNKVVYGIYHITDETSKEGVSWYDFASKIFAIESKINKKFKAPQVKPVNTKEFPRPAKRPKYSMLVNTKLSPSRNWEKALEKYLKSRKK